MFKSPGHFLIFCRSRDIYVCVIIWFDFSYFYILQMKRYLYFYLISIFLYFADEEIFIFIFLFDSIFIFCIFCRWRESQSGRGCTWDSSAKDWQVQFLFSTNNFKFCGRILKFSTQSGQKYFHFLHFPHKFGHWQLKILQLAFSRKVGVSMYQNVNLYMITTCASQARLHTWEHIGQILEALGRVHQLSGKSLIWIK